MSGNFLVEGAQCYRKRSNWRRCSAQELKLGLNLHGAGRREVSGLSDKDDGKMDKEGGVIEWKQK